jgi:lysophospholipase L1-like esterase
MARLSIPSPRRPFSRRLERVLLVAGLSCAACAGSPEDEGASPGGTPSSADGALIPPPPSDGAVNMTPPAEVPSDGTAAEGQDPNIGLEMPSGAEPAAPVAPPAETDTDERAAPEAPVEPEPARSFSAFLAGDSIVQTYADTPSSTDQAGWGQMLGAFFDANVSVVNRAIGGRTARRFIDEGRLDAVVDELEPGDYLLVQFGTNDGNRTATYELDGATIPYFLEPGTDFKAYLQRYVDAALGRGAIPVLVTPTPRNSAYCTGGNGTGGHAAAMRELAEADGVALVDLNARAVDYLRAICPAPTPEDFFLLRADGSVDGTHFQENGARILASFVADELLIVPDFAAHVPPR